MIVYYLCLVSAAMFYFCKVKIFTLGKDSGFSSEIMLSSQYLWMRELDLN